MACPLLDPGDVAVAASQKILLCDLCPALCCSAMSWLEGGLASSFGTLSGVNICDLILTCVCVGWDEKLLAQCSRHLFLSAGIGRL